VGKGLNQNNIIFSPIVFWAALLIICVVMLAFSKPYYFFSFYKKKRYDALVLLLSFVMMVAFANEKSTKYFISYNGLQSSFPTEKLVTTTTTNKSSRPSFKDLKRQFKELKKVAKSDRASTGGIIGAVLVAVLLTPLVAAASCSLECNGQGALAILVLLGGFTAIFLICWAILKISKKHPSQNEETPTPAKPAPAN
jgi:threonine/homoserine/homoserine lactone efflux protein